MGNQKGIVQSWNYDSYSDCGLWQFEISIEQIQFILQLGNLFK